MTDKPLTDAEISRLKALADDLYFPYDYAQGRVKGQPTTPSSGSPPKSTACGSWLRTHSACSRAWAAGTGRVRAMRGGRLLPSGINCTTRRATRAEGRVSE
jgi:hypothetical protein